MSSQNQHHFYYIMSAGGLPPPKFCLGPTSRPPSFFLLSFSEPSKDLRFKEPFTPLANHWATWSSISTVPGAEGAEGAMLHSLAPGPPCFVAGCGSWLWSRNTWKQDCEWEFFSCQVPAGLGGRRRSWPQPPQVTWPILPGLVTWPRVAGPNCAYMQSVPATPCHITHWLQEAF